MKLLAPTPPPYDPLTWVELPLEERGKLVCQAWALQGYGSPLPVYLAYALKVGLYVLGWVGFCSLSPSLGGLSTLSSWWLSPLAFQKAIAWSMLFEVLGLGCGSGPLTGRYLPPFGGFLYFLRPGTTKLPLFPGAPVVGRDTRGVLDVAAYAALLAALGAVLVAPSPSAAAFQWVVVLVPLCGVLDRTLFLAARSEHYWVTMVCFAATPQWLPGAMIVQLALWFFAGFSKLNHHFPTVVAVMNSNGPFTSAGWMRRAMYRDYPGDLRPSRLATVMGHLGTALELGTPLAFLLTPTGTAPVVAVGLMLLLHLYITSNVPMGVPIEWNVMVVYGGLALFWAHPDLSPFMVAPPGLAVFLVLTSVVLPVAGNLWPRAVSFLLAMRYYAGNWAYSVWLVRKDAVPRLSRLTASSPWIYDQLARFYDRRTAVGLVGKVMAFRLMHLHGRALPHLVPRVLGEARLADYEWLDGELVAGMALGWNFGDGHLHHEQLLANLQRQCGFAPGEVRCIFVESQPIQTQALTYRLADAATGSLGHGELPISLLRSHQAWSTGGLDASPTPSPAPPVLKPG